ncbi:hypothetical protein [Kordiimonas sp. SCSIO 12610]|uniref:hypothetical protein n=1 Tax=Kordiimonas sp. SCSIO 12610 TaxID=2829597 RepID=UPI00210A7B44|nr:hypothetical protein [Kordiimonas sp. SCSIO 12610]UTW53907.1 hypothetical protein KFF44_08605 [Kordiimonas sp. SCSIO 12610]
MTINYFGLDTKSIYIACEHSVGRVEWENSGEGEWYYIGDGNRLDGDRLLDFVNQFFGEEEIYLVVNRRVSFLVLAHDFLKQVSEMPNVTNYKLCDFQFKKFVQVSHVGVARRGQIRTG